MSMARIWRAVWLAHDWLIVAAVAGAGQIELWLDPFGDSDFRAPRAIDAVALLLVSLPLAWRRRAPLVVLAAVSATTVAWLNGFYNSAPQPPIEPFLALVVAIYSAAAYTDGRRTFVGAALAGAVVLGDVPALVAGRGPGDVLPAWLFYALAWLLGRGMRRRQRLTAELADRTVELEHERDENARRAAIEERARIARELHDVIAHSVSVMVLHASVERRVLPPGQDSTDEALTSIEDTGRQALAELRRLLGIMRAGGEELSLAPQPGLRQLDSLVEQVRQSGLDVDLRIEGDPAQLPPGLDLSAYRIVQEGLTNVLKHAGPARAQVVVSYGDAAIELVVRDDGRGPGRENGGGHGLAGIRERVALYGGELRIGPTDDCGFELRARLPHEVLPR